MIDLSKITEEQVVKTKDRIETYEVIRKVKDLKAIRQELKQLEEMPIPDDEVILDLAKEGYVHPYYEKYRKLRIEELKREVE